METIKKPWGCEEIIEQNSRYMLKRLTMLKGHRCSIQYHNFKHETIYVLSGQLNIYLGDTIQQLTSSTYGPNESLAIPAKLVHRMEALEDTVYLEASTPELDDVIRLKDDYQRDLDL